MVISNKPKVNQKLIVPAIIILILALATVVFYFGGPFLAKKDNGYRGPAAKLNGVTVRDQDFNQNMYQVMQEANNVASEMPTIGEILDRALVLSIKDLMLRQGIQKAGSQVIVSNTVLDQYLKRRWPTAEEMEAAMQQHGTRNKGLFKKIIRSNLEILRFYLYQGRQLKMTVSKEEVLERLERITTRHILISVLDPQTYQPIRSPGEAFQRAMEVYQKVTERPEGDNFGQLATQYSDDPDTKEQGGTPGALPLDRFKQTRAEEYVKKALALKPGEISKPVKVVILKPNEDGYPTPTIIGYYIIQFISREMPKGADYQLQYQEAADDLLLQKTQEPNSPYIVWEQENLKKALNQMEVIDPFLKGYRLLQAGQWAEAAPAFEKAMLKKYYQDQRETYLYAAKAYSNMKQIPKAINVLEKAQKKFKDMVDYQVALAKLYKENQQPDLAAKTLANLSANHMAIASEAQIHETIKNIYAEWQMPEAAAKEAEIIAALKKKE
ncbi:MAG TPA: peptidylprolyl isomerase [Bacillota bacterium]|nr:peptidylprolyl isomerase [Bacillota bacterium]